MATMSLVDVYDGDEGEDHFCDGLWDHVEGVYDGGGGVEHRGECIGNGDFDDAGDGSDDDGDGDDDVGDVYDVGFGLGVDCVDYGDDDDEMDVVIMS